MAAAGIVWEVPPSVLAKATADYARRLYQAVVKLADYFGARIEAYGKTHARWTDRTGNARSGLTAKVIPAAAAVTILFAQTVSYGIWLEVAHQGRFAIVLESLQVHYGEIMSALTRLAGA